MPSKKIKVLFASYECAPFYKVGGLGDVACSLPKALSKLGADIRVVLPYYLAIKKNYPSLNKISSLKISIAGEQLAVDIFESQLPGSSVPVYFLANKYFAVADIFDAASRFRFTLFSALLARAGELFHWQPDIIHLNDWHTALVPTFLKKSQPAVKTIFTIHNLAYSGGTSLQLLARFGLAASDFSSLKNNTLNPLREAISQSDLITTVSPTYAKEILTPEFGCGLEDVLQQIKKDLSGILNGLDYQFFNPTRDPYLKINYSQKSLSKKIFNKHFLQNKAGLPTNSAVPLVALIGRLASQKGFDLLAKILPDIFQLPVQLVILGSGEKCYEETLTLLSQKYPRQFRFFPIFDPALANQIYAGADIFVMPSRYEPCGLGQLIAMRYGTLPLVRATGGLKDTVINFTGKNTATATGFVFKDYDSTKLFAALKRAINLFPNHKIWRKLQLNGMSADFSWCRSARQYLRLYRHLQN
ncbi:glycogen synthase [Candidatus Kuenenbacteria bacterium]|nr:glycogen synthase [Candidatus Kuenenbacteria bacterium]